MSESQNFFVSSRGLLKSCDFFSQTPISSIRVLVNYFDKDFQKIATMNNPTIYVCASAIPHFVDNLLPHINFPFILVSGDCDETAPYELFSNSDSFNSFLNDARLVHWFCQNMTFVHSKITNMPIGLDYHTMTVNTMWGDITSCADQEKLLKSAIAESKPFWERQIKCYSNFHFSMSTKYGQDRKDAYAQIPPDLVFYEPKHLPRLETWNAQTDYAFLISPHGNGLDCHRTWEALVLGCIPIVKTSNIDILYDDLPVLIVNNWSDVSDDLLKTTVNDFKKRTFNYEKLLLQYWTKKINDIQNC